MFNVLEGDGVIENIYHFLWTKDTIFNSDPKIFIPHTVLYKYRRPLYWYFTSIIDHKIKKKNSDKLNIEHIKEAFLKNISKSGIVCYFIYQKKSILSKYESDKPTFEKTMKSILDNIDNSNIKSKYQSSNIKNLKVESSMINGYNVKTNLKKDEYIINSKKYIIEYFDKEQFIEFLNNKPKFEEGILQKFEDPKGEYNTVYRITWSPKLSLFEKCSNLKKLNDKHYDIYERAVTYDGEEFQTKKEPVKGSHLPKEMQNLAMKIVDHVSNITLEKIKIIRMILNFKIDKRDRIIFLWCSSLRIDSNQRNKNLYNKRNNSYSGKDTNKNNILETRIKSVDESKIKLNHPDDINIFKYSILGKPIQPHKESYCLNCGLSVENYKLYEISFKHLIEGHENLKRDSQYFPVYEKINMTSNGIDVMTSKENDNNNNDIRNEITKRLKTYNFNNFVIPKVISHLFPKLSYNDYNKLKKEIIFMNKKVFICDTCYLEITKYCSMAGSNNVNLLRTVKKDEKNLNNIHLVRPKSVNKFNFSNMNINIDNYNNSYSKNILSPYLSKKKLKNIFQRTNSFNNGSNLYQNYFSNLNHNKNAVKKKIKSFFLQNYDNQSNINNNNKLSHIKNKFNQKNKFINQTNSTLNHLNILSQENNKEINMYFLKNRKKINKYAKFFSNSNNNTYNNARNYDNISFNSNLETKQFNPIKLHKFNINSTNTGSTKDDLIINFLDKKDFKYHC